MTKRSYHVINLLWLQGRRARGKQNNMQVREFCFWILSRYRNDLEQLICIFCSTFLEFSIIFGLALENHYNAQKRCLHSHTPPIVFLAIRRSIQCTSLLVVLFSLRLSILGAYKIPDYAINCLDQVCFKISQLPQLGYLKTVSEVTNGRTPGACVVSDL